MSNQYDQVLDMYCTPWTPAPLNNATASNLSKDQVLQQVRNNDSYHTTSKNGFVKPFESSFSDNYRNGNQFASTTATSCLTTYQPLPVLPQEVQKAWYNNVQAQHVSAAEALQISSADPYSKSLFIVSQGAVIWDPVRQMSLTPAPGQQLVVPYNMAKTSGDLFKSVLAKATKEVRTTTIRRNLNEIITETIEAPWFVSGQFNEPILCPYNTTITNTRKEINRIKREYAFLIKSANQIASTHNTSMHHRFGAMLQVTSKDLERCGGCIFDNINGQWAKIGDIITYGNKLTCEKLHRAAQTKVRREIRKPYNDAVKVLSREITKNIIISNASPDAYGNFSFCIDDHVSSAFPSTPTSFSNDDTFLSNTSDITEINPGYCDILKKSILAHYAKTIRVGDALHIILDDNVTPPAVTEEIHGVTYPVNEVVDSYTSPSGVVYYHHPISNLYTQEDGQVFTVTHAIFKASYGDDVKEKVYKQISENCTTVPVDRPVAPVLINLTDGVSKVNIAAPEEDRMIIQVEDGDLETLKKHEAFANGTITAQSKLLVGGQISDAELEMASQLINLLTTADKAVVSRLYNVSNPELLETVKFWNKKYRGNGTPLSDVELDRYHFLVKRDFSGNEDSLSTFISNNNVFSTSVIIKGPICNPQIKRARVAREIKIPKYDPQLDSGYGSIYSVGVEKVSDYHMLDVDEGITPRIYNMLLPQSRDMIESFMVEMRKHNIKAFPIGVMTTMVARGIVNDRTEFLEDIDLELWKTSEVITIITQTDAKTVLKDPRVIMRKDGVLKYPIGPLLSRGMPSLPSPVVPSPSSATVPERDIFDEVNAFMEIENVNNFTPVNVPVVASHIVLLSRTASPEAFSSPLLPMPLNQATVGNNNLLIPKEEAKGVEAPASTLIPSLISQMNKAVGGEEEEAFEKVSALAPVLHVSGEEEEEEEEKERFPPPLLSRSFPRAAKRRNRVTKKQWSWKLRTLAVEKNNESIDNVRFLYNIESASGKIYDRLRNVYLATNDVSNQYLTKYPSDVVTKDPTSLLQRFLARSAGRKERAYLPQQAINTFHEYFGVAVKKTDVVITNDMRWMIKNAPGSSAMEEEEDSMFDEYIHYPVGKVPFSLPRDLHSGFSCKFKCSYHCIEKSPTKCNVEEEETGYKFNLDVDNLDAIRAAIAISSMSPEQENFYYDSESFEDSCVSNETRSYADNFIPIDCLPQSSTECRDSYIDFKIKTQSLIYTLAQREEENIEEMFSEKFTAFDDIENGMMSREMVLIDGLRRQNKTPSEIQADKVLRREVMAKWDNRKIFKYSELSHDGVARLYSKLSKTRYLESEDLMLRTAGEMIDKKDYMKPVPAQDVYVNMYIFDAQVANTFGHRTYDNNKASVAFLKDLSRSTLSGMCKHYNNEALHILFLKENVEAQKWFLSTRHGGEEPSWWHLFMNATGFTSPVCVFKGMNTEDFWVDHTVLPKEGLRYLIDLKNDRTSVYDSHAKIACRDHDGNDKVATYEAKLVRHIKKSGLIVPHMLQKEVELWKKYPKNADAAPIFKYDVRSIEIRNILWKLFFTGKKDKVVERETEPNSIGREIFPLPFNSLNMFTSATRLYHVALEEHNNIKHCQGKIRRNSPGTRAFGELLEKYLNSTHKCLEHRKMINSKKDVIINRERMHETYRKHESYFKTLLAEIARFQSKREDQVLAVLAQFGDYIDIEEYLEKQPTIIETPDVLLDSHGNPVVYDGYGRVVPMDRYGYEFECTSEGEVIHYNQHIILTGNETNLTCIEIQQNAHYIERILTDSEENVNMTYKAEGQKAFDTIMIRRLDGRPTHQHQGRMVFPDGSIIRFEGLYENHYDDC